jgi:hypothetical protein
VGLNQVLPPLAVRRARVLVAEMPGQWAVRAALEARLAARGWGVALSPADADVLAVCGRTGSAMADIINRLWEQMPGPRVRVDINSADSIDAALDHATACLLDVTSQRNDARHRSMAPETSGGHDHHENHQHHHDEHGGGDNHQMQMAPAGIALAEGGDDRDGLEMDVLHVRLGPVLGHWPAGLVLRCALQGDVITGARAWILDTGTGLAGSRPAAARQCDHLTDVLALAGWRKAAAIARRARDLLLSDADADSALVLLHRLQRSVPRSRILRWSLRGVGQLTGAVAERTGLPRPYVGDSYDRLLARLDYAQQIAADPLSPSAFGVAPERLVAAIPGIVGGLDVGAARLVIAGMGVDTGSSGSSGQGRSGE